MNDEIIWTEEEMEMTDMIVDEERLMPKKKRKDIVIITKEMMDLVDEFVPKWKIDPSMFLKKRAVLIGLKHPDPPAQNNAIDVKQQILRVKDFLIGLRGFTEEGITVMIDDDDEGGGMNHVRPTELNIRSKLCSLMGYAKKDHILYIHLIAHGCCEDCILSADKYHIPDSFFRSVISEAVNRGCNLTFVCDCLIEPGHNCSPVPLTEERREEARKSLAALEGYVVVDYRCLCPTDLSSVDILNPKQDKKNTEQGDDDDDDDSSRVVLLMPFRDQNAATTQEDGDFFQDVSELFIPPPKGIASPQHTLYGGFTNAILEVIAETDGQVTNLDLAQKAMKKLGEIPSLRCSHHHNAYASFVS
ncbi:hypothetical protein OROGR_028656 [Orobanche gracilis]